MAYDFAITAQHHNMSFNIFAAAAPVKARFLVHCLIDHNIITMNIRCGCTAYVLAPHDNAEIQLKYKFLITHRGDGGEILLLCVYICPI